MDINSTVLHFYNRSNCKMYIKSLYQIRNKELDISNFILCFRMRYFQKINLVNSLATKKCKLNAGNITIIRGKSSLPLFGIGCYKMERHKTEKTIGLAIENGYRLFDTAQSYENECHVGNAIKWSGLSRQEYFVSTKLSTEHGYKNTQTALMRSLEELQLEYVDLYMVHEPSKGKILETWQAFQELKEAGFTKEIGVSNFNIHHLEGISSAGYVMPDVNQIEHHPWHQQSSIVEYCTQRNISIMGYCPLARMQLKSKVVDDIATKYYKTFGQILLRWSIQRDIITIPKSTTPERILENIQIFDFSLSQDEMESINQLECAHQIASINAIYEPWKG